MHFQKLYFIVTICFLLLQMGNALRQRIHPGHAPAGIFDPAYLTPLVAPFTAGGENNNGFTKHRIPMALTPGKWETVRRKGCNLLQAMAATDAEAAS